MPTTTEWTLTIISDVIHFGCIIAIVFTLKRFYAHRYSQALQKRSPLLVYLMNICFVFYLLSHITDKIAYIYGVKDWNLDPILKGEKVRPPHIIGLISMICYIFSLHGMAIMWIARSWIIYFNSQYSLELQKSEWGDHINNRYSDTLWFVKHRRDYGSKRVIYPVAITLYIIHALFQTFLMFKFPDIRRIYDSASWFIELTISVIIWYKLPSFNDIFGIKKEMQWILRVSGIAIFLYIGYMVNLMLLGHNLWIFMIAQLIFGIMISIMAFILNGFIFHNSNYKYLTSTLQRRRSRTLSSRSFLAISAGEKLSLSRVLENAQLIECFFLHLADEFSVELLLALIEFKQFHDLMINDEEFMAGIQQTISGGDTRISESILSDIFLSDELPKSNIVHENYCENEEDHDHIKVYLRIARDLFNKYVSNRAEFQVNLSFGCRQKVAYFVEQYSHLSEAVALNETEQLDLFVLFNGASSELCHLLNSSHNRYIKANKYYPTSSPMCI